MGFPEAVKHSVRRKSHLQCCLCKSIGIEIHHILPAAEGGPDTEGNAAPLCPSCHEIFGANPVKRKFITEARDIWYDICRERYASDNDRIERLIDLLEGATAAFTGFHDFVTRIAGPEPETHTRTLPATVAISVSDVGTISVEETVAVSEVDGTGDDDEHFRQEPRSEVEVLEALERLFDQIWYNRHWIHRTAIDEGRKQIDPEVWKLALEGAAEVEAKYKDDPEALGPWDDFEWGMLNGKMSALRWVLGEEWDFLDT